MKQACLLAIALAGCPTAALAQGTFDYTYVEAVYQGNDVNTKDGYGIQGSFAITDHWFIFGSYTRNSDGSGDSSIFGRNVPGEAYDFEEDYKRIGVGFHFALNPDLDVVSRLMYDRGDGEERNQFYSTLYVDPLAVPGAVYYSFDVRSEAVQAEAGLRGRVLPAWELWGMAGYARQQRVDISNPRATDYTVAALCPDLSCGLQPSLIEEVLEEDSRSSGDPYARLGTLVRLTDHWGLTAEGRFAPGGVVSYYAGVRFSF